MKRPLWEQVIVAILLVLMPFLIIGTAGVFFTSLWNLSLPTEEQLRWIGRTIVVSYAFYFLAFIATS